jgi:hypothetical protein
MLLRRLCLGVLICSLLGCGNPTGSNSHATSQISLPVATPECTADPNWLPKTVQPTDKDPNSPDVDCPFYQASWQHFLFATQADTTGRPAFFAYKTIAELFGSATAPLFGQGRSTMLMLAPRVAERPNDSTDLTQAQKSVIGSDVFQAGLRGLLIDQKGQPVFYAIHVNKSYDDFITNKNLKNPAALRAAPDDLVFPMGVVELKSAWQIVDTAAPPSNYIIATATVPSLKVQGKMIIVDTDHSHDRTVTVALLALHVVFVLDGHPEFIWSTFEHVDSNGVPDLAPPAAANPTGPPGGEQISPKDYTLYKAGTLASQANKALVTDQGNDPLLTFDTATQTFRTKSGVGQTSIYRMFPGSKSSDKTVDDEVQALNDSMSKLFGVNSTDRRANYRLVGGVWLKHSKDSVLGFKLNDIPDDMPGQSTDDPKSRLQGEDRLSGMAMESFTQPEGSFKNCFQCHNTQQVKDDDTADPIIGPKMLNVSHVLSKFLSSQGTVRRSLTKTKSKTK